MESLNIGPPFAYTLGVDIGQARDPTAIALVERRRRQAASKEIVVHTARFLERLPLGMPYPAIASRLAEVVRNANARAREEFERAGVEPPNQSALGFRVFIDATGVGRPVVDVLQAEGLRVMPVFFTHGDRRTLGDDHITLGKAWLVSRLKTLFQTERVRLPPNHPEAAAMIDELQNYEIRVNEKANDTYGAFKVGKHDDLVTALGLATQDDQSPVDVKGTLLAWSRDGPSLTRPRSKIGSKLYRGIY